MDAPSLADSLKARLRDGERITFADYMQLAGRRYYARGPAIGAEGDFYTAVSLPGFAPALARALAHARERLGSAAFTIVEIGGGTGELAASVTRALDDNGLRGAYEYVLVEPSGALADLQRKRTGLTVVPDLGRIEPLSGVVLANEVLDALPVHRITRLPSGEVAEMYLALEGEGIVERPGPLSTPALGESGEGLPEGAIVEASLLTGPFLRAVRATFSQGYAFFLDYGDERALLRETRPHGTARTYAAHEVSDDFFAAPGEEDVTADVDFTDVKERALEAGFEVAGFATQGEFLLDLGIAEMYADLARTDPVEALKMKTLFLPGGMGERFKVLALAKDAPVEPPLAGFRGRRA